MSLPGLTGQSSIPGRWLLDRPVKPGDDTMVELTSSYTVPERVSVRFDLIATTSQIVFPAIPGKRLRANALEL